MPATEKPETRHQKQLRTRSIIADTAMDIFFESRLTTSVDELLCRPKEALRVANAVRRKLAPIGMKPTDYDICKALLNGRKNGDIARREKRKV